MQFNEVEVAVLFYFFTLYIHYSITKLRLSTSIEKWINFKPFVFICSSIKSVHHYALCFLVQTQREKLADITP